MSFRNELVELQPNLRRFGMRLTGDWDSAKDLAGWATLKALENETSFIPGSNMRAWLFTIMRNLFITEKRHFNLGYEQQWDQEVCEAYSDCDHTKAESATELSDVVASLHSLKKEYRDAFLLLIGGVSYEDIARKLNIPVGTVKSRIYRGRLALLRVKVRASLRPETGEALNSVLQDIQDVQN